MRKEKLKVENSNNGEISDSRVVVFRAVKWQDKREVKK
jgi:hypothetical protein